MNKKNLFSGIFPGMPILLVTLIILISAASCLKRPEKKEFKRLIPEKDFVSILNDLYLTNGLLGIPGVRNRYMNPRDTSGIYVEIIEGYGYRKGQMDTTIQYYYIRKPKRLIKIYDQMLGKFTELNLRLEQKYITMPVIVDDQWKGSPSYFLPDRGEKEKPGFEITLTSPGTYTLQFSLTIYPDDQTHDPYFTAWLCNADSLESGKRNYLPCFSYIKDGTPHVYTIIGTHTGNTNVVLKGWLYDFASNPDNGGPNALLDDITFYYSGAVR
jgi:hypothetical protein